MQKNGLSLLAAFALSTVLVTACQDTKPKPEIETRETPTEQAMPKMEESKDIVDVAIGSADHTTLVTAIKAAGLVETLKGVGAFTVFAPTNAAFAALPAGTVEGLLKPEKKAALTKILTYHVVAGALKAADLKDGQKIKTVQGENLTVSVKDGKVMVNGATVTTADLNASNGVIHVIDAVLMPK